MTTPTLFKDMAKDEQKEILFAWYHKKPLQAFLNGVWKDRVNKDLPPLRDVTYRLKPEEEELFAEPHRAFKELREDVYRIRAMLTAEEIERLWEWQPIETAPVDGTYVILYVKSHAPLGPNRLEFGRKGANGWCRQDLKKIYGTPTHWVPLPPCPKENKDD